MNMNRRIRDLVRRLLLPAALLPAFQIWSAGSSSEPVEGHSNSSSRHTNHFARAPYVQLATHQSIVVVWRTDGPIQPGVRFGTSVTALDMETTPSGIVTRVAFSHHNAQVDALGDDGAELVEV